MAKDPAFLFYPGDWQGGTSTFSRFLKGCYMDVLIAQFNNGHLSIEEIKTVLGSDFGQSWPALQKKFKTDQTGLFFNEKLETEIFKRKNYVQSRSNNRKNKTYEQSYEKHINKDMDNEDVNESRNEKEDESIVWPNFEDFWNEYDKKVGEKGKVKSKWDKLKQEEKERIMSYVPDYKLSQPDKKYRKNPDTFLNNKSWNDELIFDNGKQGTTNEKRTKWANHFAKGTGTGN